MIEDVKSFLEKVFLLELEVRNARYVADLGNYNTKVKRLYSHCVPAMRNKLGVIERRSLRSEDFYEKYKGHQSANPRVIFKISQYKQQAYVNLYLAYVSESALNDKASLNYSDCFFVIQENGEYKIASGYFIYTEFPDTIRWMKHGGQEDLTFENTGELVAIERYTEPVYNKKRPEESAFGLAWHRAEK